MAESAPTILVVDDDESMRAFYLATLRRAKYEPLVAENGSAALEILSSTHVDCMLIDSRMPIMTGPETVAKLRSLPQFFLLPIIMVTGSDGLEERIKGLDLGANDYLVKPVDPSELLARIRAHLRTSSNWLDATRAVLQQRLGLVEALGKIDSSSDLATMASVVVDHLEVLDGVRNAAIYAFSKRDVAIMLAGSANHPLNSDSELPRNISRSLMEMAYKGPLLLEPGVDERWWSRSNSDMVFTNPLGNRDDSLGMLVICSEGATLTESAGRSLSIDAANVTNSVLGPHLRKIVHKESSAQQIRDALSSDETHVVYQPIIDLTQPRVVGYEALTRFGDKVRPDHRLSDARSVGILDEIELALFKLAVDSSSELPSDAWISINLSATVLVANPELGNITGNTSRQLVIEVTEHEPILDYQEVRRAISSLQGQPLLSIDDAGAGYASLRHIFELSPSFVKLDREWVSGIDSDPIRQSLVDALVSFSQRSGAMLIAEGIETRPELHTLVKAGVNLGQGYLLGRPMPPPGEPVEKLHNHIRETLSA